MSLSLVFNPISGTFDYVDSGSAVWGAPVANLAALNAITTDAPWTVRVVENVASAYVWNGSSWVFLNLVAQANVGSSSNAQGYSIDTANTLTLQPANTSFPGVLLASDWNTFNNKANANLNNLTSPTAINQALIPNGSNTLDIGSSSKLWQHVYTSQLTDGVGDVINLSGGILISSGTGIVLSGGPITVESNMQFASAVIQDASALTSIDPNSRYLYADDGSTIQIDYSSPTVVNIPTSLTVTGAVSGSNLTAGGHAILDILASTIGQPNGVASLDPSGKIPSSELPSTILEYQGLWNPSTNTPTLQDSTGINGYVYQVSVNYNSTIAGLNSPTMTNFLLGNLVIFSSAAGEWQQTTAAAGVSSVNGAQGAVTVNAINQLTGDVAAGPATQSQSEVATIQPNVVSNSKLAQMPGNTVKANTTNATANASDVALGTLTEATSSVLTLSGWSDATIGSPTIQVKQATTSQSGYLSSTDWNTFNNKQASGNYITALTGDVVASGPGSSSSTIQANVVSNSKLAQMPANTVKANTTGSTANASDVALGTLTESTSAVLVLTGWSDATIGAPTIQVKQSSSTQSGYLSSTDWNTFNNKGSSNTGDIAPSNFALANNQSSASNITGLSFSSSVHGATIFYSIVISATSSLYESGTIQVCNTGGPSWQLTQQSTGNSSLVTISITSAGQLQYTTPNYSGFSSGTIYFRALAT